MKKSITKTKQQDDHIFNTYTNIKRNTLKEPKLTQILKV